MFRTRFCWLSITPLGSPVVPEVVDDGGEVVPATAAASRSAAAGSAARASLPALMTADQGSPPAPGSKVKTVSTFGSRSRASAIFALLFGIGSDDHPRSRVPDDVRRLRRGQRRVDRHRDRPEDLQSRFHGEPLHPVLGKERHPVPLRHAPRGEPERHFPRRLEPGRGGHLPPLPALLVEEGVLLVMPRAGGGEQLIQGLHFHRSRTSGPPILGHPPRLRTPIAPPAPQQTAAHRPTTTHGNDLRCEPEAPPAGTGWAAPPGSAAP